MHQLHGDLNRREDRMLEKNSLTLVVRAALTGILPSAFSEFTQSTLRGNWGPIVNWITIHFVAFLFWRKKSRHMTNAISMRHTHGIPLTIFINASLYVSFYSSLRNGTWLHMVNRAMCLLPLYVVVFHSIQCHSRLALLVLVVLAVLRYDLW